MNTAADGVMGALLAIVGALLVIAACVLRWVVRFTWRHRSRIPHGNVVVPAAGVCGPVLLIGGAGAVTVVGAGAAVVAGWLVGTPILERRYHDSGEAAPRPLSFAASTARIVTRKLAALQVRLAWRQAVKTVGLEPVRVLGVETIPAGHRLRVRFSAGQHSGHLERARDSLASALRARSVTAYSHATDARLGSIIIAVGTDPLADLGGQHWPALNAQRMSLWDPIPVAVDADGRTVNVTLPERSMLVGGAPGGGKSASMSMLVAAAALDDADLYILDGKMVDLAVWQPCSAGFAGASIDDALAVLKAVRADMESRYRWLRDNGQRKVPDGYPLTVLVADELAFYYGTGSKPKRTEFGELLRDIVARGRAAGVLTLASTQKPSTDTIPSAFRDLFGYRWALRSTTPQASDTILGAGWVSRGHDASTIATGQPGVGLLLAEDGQPRRCRAFYLDDRDLDAIAQRATARRRAEGEGHTHPHKVFDESAAPVPVPVPVPAAADDVRNSAAAPETLRVSAPRAESPQSPPAVPDAPEPRRLVVVPEEMRVF